MPDTGEGDVGECGEVEEGEESEGGEQRGLAEGQRLREAEEEALSDPPGRHPAQVHSTVQKSTVQYSTLSEDLQMVLITKCSKHSLGWHHTGPGSQSPEIK